MMRSPRCSVKIECLFDMTGGMLSLYIPKRDLDADHAVGSGDE